MQKHLTVVFSRLGSAAGAEGTLTDFCKAAIENGHACTVIVGRSTRKQRRLLRDKLRFPRTRTSSLAVISAGRMLDFFVARAVHQDDFFSTRRLPLTSSRFLANPIRSRVKTTLQKSTHVLVGNVLTDRGESQLRALSPRAELIFNHNGEPVEFYNERVARGLTRRPRHTPAKASAYADSLKNFDQILFQSEGQKDDFEQCFPGLSLTKRVIWPSCDESTARAMARARSPLPGNKFNIVCVAKFQPGKGQFELLSAFKALIDRNPGIHLSFVGGSVADRSYRDQCVRFVRSHKLDQDVSFYGARDDAPAFTAHGDLFALTSVGEGVSRAVREAAFLGVPIVATRLTGSESFLSPEGAFFAESQSTSAIVSALENAFLDPQSRQHKAGIAAERYKTLSRWDVFSRSVQEMISGQ